MKLVRGDGSASDGCGPVASGAPGTNGYESPRPTGHAKPPAKSRRVKPDCPHHDRQQRRQRRDDWDDRSAPGHMGGQFDEAGYSSGRGQFGFRHETLQ